MEFIMNNLYSIGASVWVIGTAGYIIYKKKFDHINYHTFKTTEYKKQFKKYQQDVNDSVKNNKLFS